MRTFPSRLRTLSPCEMNKEKCGVKSPDRAKCSLAFYFHSTSSCMIIFPEATEHIYFMLAVNQHHVSRLISRQVCSMQVFVIIATCHRITQMEISSGRINQPICNDAEIYFLSFVIVIITKTNAFINRESSIFIARNVIYRNFVLCGIYTPTKFQIIVISYVA